MAAADPSPFQTSTALVRFRRRLAVARGAGVAFDDAWRASLPLLPARTHYREAVDATREVWRLAYERQPDPAHRCLSLVHEIDAWRAAICLETVRSPRYFRDALRRRRPRPRPFARPRPVGTPRTPGPAHRPRPRPAVEQGRWLIAARDFVGYGSGAEVARIRAGITRIVADHELAARYPHSWSLGPVRKTKLRAGTHFVEQRDGAEVVRLIAPGQQDTPVEAPAGRHVGPLRGLQLVDGDQLGLGGSVP